LPTRAARPGPALSPQQAINLVNSEGGVFVDLRDAAAFKQGHIVDAMHIPMAKLAERSGELDRLSRQAGGAGLQHGPAGRRAASSCGPPASNRSTRWPAA
jgi:rhodanese-related sulfurtransferase